jgi:hypothetical protein
MRLIVSFDTDAPYTSARCALISPDVRPFAESDKTIWSTPFNLRYRIYPDHRL